MRSGVLVVMAFSSAFRSRSAALARSSAAVRRTTRWSSSVYASRMARSDWRCASPKRPSRSAYRRIQPTAIGTTNAAGRSQRVTTAPVRLEASVSSSHALGRAAARPIAASIVATAAGAEKPRSGAAMSKRSTRRLSPRSAKKATAPTMAAARLVAGAPNTERSRSSGVTSAIRMSVMHAAIESRGGAPPRGGGSHWKLMPSGSPRSVSASVSAPIKAASAAATRALRGRPRSAAKKLVASSTSASAAAGDIGAKSAPRSRSAGTPSTQPQIAAAPSAATMPKAPRETRASLSTSVEEERTEPEPSGATSEFLSAEWLRPRRHARPVAERRRLRVILFSYLGEKVLRHRHRRAELRLDEPGDAGHEQARDHTALRLLLGLLGDRRAVRVLAAQATRREEAEHRGTPEHPRRGERAQRLAAGVACGRLDAMAPVGDALLDFVDFLVGRNHWAAIIGEVRGRVREAASRAP